MDNALAFRGDLSDANALAGAGAGAQPLNALAPQEGGQGNFLQRLAPYTDIFGALGRLSPDFSRLYNTMGESALYLTPAGGPLMARDAWHEATKAPPPSQGPVEGDSWDAWKKRAELLNQSVGSTMLPLLGIVKAFHGSPHDFDRFDMSKINSGEGNQAYGHGLYFTEKEGIGKYYQERLAERHHNHGWDPNDNALYIDGKLVTGRSNPDVPAGAYTHLMSANGDLDAAIEHATSGMQISQRLAERERSRFFFPWQSAERNHSQEMAKIHQDWAGRDAKAIEHLNKWKSENPKIEMKPPPEIEKGRLYNVDLDVEPHHLLDWDKPVSAQSPQVQESLNKVQNPMFEAWKQSGAWPDHVTGETLYRELAGGLTRGAQTEGKHVVASRILKDAGVPGLRYLDQGSRTAGEGTHNYVIFDDKLVNVTGKK